MLPSGTVTFLFTDIEGSTRLWESNPDRMRVALEAHNASLNRVAAEFSGEVFKTVGDAFCIAFASAEDAAAAAVAAQAALAHAHDPLLVRMGLHTASIRPTGDDYFGPPLNRVARIMSAAEGGQILMSDATRTLLPSGFVMRDLGSHALRDLLEPTRLWQLGAGDFAELRTLSSVPNNLPEQTTSFIGRAEEMAALEDLLSRSRLVTLTGTGGTGKSRLSLQFAADHLERFPEGVWFCELAALPERDDVLRAIISAVGAPESNGTPLERLNAHFSGKQCLLILDNCEHVVDAASQIAESVVMASPSVTVIATSREQLGARGETAYRVPSLPTPDLARQPRLEDLDRFGSTALFIDRLATAAPTYSIEPSEATTIVKICQRLDGIPLAIELAAARGRAMTLEHIERRLDDRFRLLTGGSRNALSRQQTLRALIDWSVQLLDVREQRFFLSLSVFAGDWSMEAAEVVCADPEAGIEGWEVLDLLTALVDKSLVVFDRTQARYRFLESVRQYALELLERDVNALTLRDRHASYFLDSAHFEKLQTAEIGVQPAHRWLGVEYENFRNAVEWYGGRDETSEIAVAALVRAWGGFYSLGRPREFVRLIEQLLSTERSPCSPQLQMTAERLLVNSLVICGDPRGYNAALAMIDRLDQCDAYTRTQWRTSIAYSLFLSRRFDECVEFARASIAGEMQADSPLFGYVYVHIGNSLACLGRYDEALAAHVEAQRLHAKNGDQRAYVANLANIANVSRLAGDPRRALEAALEAERIIETTRLYFFARRMILMIFGHQACDAGRADLGGVFFGGIHAGSQAISQLTIDPLDQLGEDGFEERLRREADPDALERAISEGHRIDWEPWHAAISKLTVDQVLAVSDSVPFAELLRM